MKRLIPWLILGGIIRLTLMPITMHPDFRAYSFASYLISQRGEVLTFYDHIRNLPREDNLVLLYGDGWLIYPPLAYLSHAIFMKVLTPIYPWDAFHLLISDIGSVVSHPDIYRLLYLSKLPYLVADIAILWLLWRYLPEKSKKIGAVLWILNPITIYSAYMMGQFDIFIALFILASVFLTTSKFPWLAGVSLGIAAGFKPFSLVMLPFLPNQKIASIVAGLATYGLIIAPYLTSIGYRQYALLASQADKIFAAKISVSGSQYLPIFVVGITLLFWFNLLKPKLLAPWNWLASPLLLFYSVTHFHPQWFTWISPLLVLYLLASRVNIMLVGVIVACVILITLSFDTSLSSGLFYSFSLPVLAIPDHFVSIVRGVLAGSSIVLLFRPGSDK